MFVLVEYFLQSTIKKYNGDRKLCHKGNISDSLFWVMECVREVESSVLVGYGLLKMWSK